MSREYRQPVPVRLHNAGPVRHPTRSSSGARDLVAHAASRRLGRQPLERKMVHLGRSDGETLSSQFDLKTHAAAAIRTARKA